VALGQVCRLKGLPSAEAQENAPEDVGVVLDRPQREAPGLRRGLEVAEQPRSFALVVGDDVQVAHGSGHRTPVRWGVTHDPAIPFRLSSEMTSRPKGHEMPGKAG
jgi:hypothetical protein